MALIRMASVRRTMSMQAVLSFLVYCTCARLMLLSHPATIHATSPVAQTSVSLHKHDDHDQLQAADRFDTVRLFPHTQRAKSLHEPEQQHRPDHAFSAPVAKGAPPGLGHPGVPQHSPHSRTVDASPPTRPRREQQQQRRSADLYEDGVQLAGVARVVGDDAVVTGLASAELQAAFQAEYDMYTDADDDFDGPFEAAGARGASRSLLQSRRRPSQYHRCPRCTLNRCDTARCDGRCKRNRRLFECRTNPRSRSAAQCIPDENVVVAELPISTLDSHTRLAVSAPSPYIGCALIADRGSSCPAPGTRGQTRVPGRSVPVAFEVGTSTCAYQRYDPFCGPNHPFGICLCSRVSLDGSSLGAGPCDISELDIVNSPPARGEEEVVIETRGSVTYTGYSDYGESDRRVAGYELSITEASLTASIDSMPELFEGVSDVSVEVGGAIEVTLDVFEVNQDVADEDRVYDLPAGAEVVVSADYYDGSDAPTTGLGRAVAVRRERVRVPAVRHRDCDFIGQYDRYSNYYYDYDCYSYMYDYDYEYEYVQYYV